jgi:hypothetical protein
VTKSLGKQISGSKYLFWLVVSEVSVHGQLSSLLLGCVDAEHYSGERMQWKKGTHYIMARKQRGRDKKGRGSRYIFQVMPTVTYFFQNGPIS